MQQTKRSAGWISAIALLILPTHLSAESNEELAKQLANPVAALISVPFEFKIDQNVGAAGAGTQRTLVAKPVIPISLNEDWNLITRTIIPFVGLSDVTPGSSESGFGDTQVSMYFSPKQATARGVTWGLGPIIQIPTSRASGTGKGDWGAGLSGLALKQSGPWTIGLLASHTWDVGGASAQQSDTFVQPFLNYTTPSAWTFVLNTESTYDWVAKEWSVPINVNVKKLVTIGQQRVSFLVGARKWVRSSTNGPEGWGLTFGATLLFPK